MNNQSITTTLTRICISTTLAIIVAFLFFNVAWANNPQMENNSPTRMTIPTLGLQQEIQSVGVIPIVVDGNTYYTWDVLDNHVGWHNRSAQLGQVGNTVLSGHSDIKGQVFRDLHQVQIGDEIIVDSAGQSHHYLVTQKLLVQEKGASIETRMKNAQWISPSDDERLTLVTCAGPGATHRLLVIAYPTKKSG